MILVKIVICWIQWFWQIFIFVNLVILLNLVIYFGEFSDFVEFCKIVTLVNLMILVFLLKLYSSKEIVDFVAFHAVLILSASLSISACTWNQVKKVFFFVYFWYGKQCDFKIMEMVVVGRWRNHRRLCCVSFFSNSFFRKKKMKWKWIKTD